MNRTAWAALTGGVRRRLLMFTDAICSFIASKQGEFNLWLCAPQHLPGSHRVCLTLWWMVYYSCCNVFNYVDSLYHINQVFVGRGVSPSLSP